MMNKIRILYRQYRDVISYLFFGGCTTAINIICYYVCVRFFHMTTQPGTIMAWLASVLFAYFTNKLFVFESRSWDRKTVIPEIISFFGCRLLTGGMDLLIMSVFVDYLHLYDMAVKITSNIMVIVLNYIASRFLIFKDPKKDSTCQELIK